MAGSGRRSIARGWQWGWRCLVHVEKGERIEGPSQHLFGDAPDLPEIADQFACARRGRQDERLSMKIVEPKPARS
jgi:hypothetical protein